MREVPRQFHMVDDMVISASLLCSSDSCTSAALGMLLPVVFPKQSSVTWTGMTMTIMTRSCDMVWHVCFESPDWAKMLQGSFRAIFEHLDTDNSGQLDMGEAGSLPESLVYFLAIDGLNHPQSSAHQVRQCLSIMQHFGHLWTQISRIVLEVWADVGRCGQLGVGSWFLYIFVAKAQLHLAGWGCWDKRFPAFHAFGPQTVWTARSLAVKAFEQTWALLDKDSSGSLEFIEPLGCSHTPGPGSNLSKKRCAMIHCDVDYLISLLCAYLCYFTPFTSLQSTTCPHPGFEAFLAESAEVHWFYEARTQWGNWSTATPSCCTLQVYARWWRCICHRCCPLPTATDRATS